MFHIYFMPLSGTEWTTKDDSLLNCISKERAAQVLRCRSDADKRLSLFAALLTRFALAGITGLPADTFTFETDQNHRPHLTPNFDPQLDFNFSHTRNAVLAGVSDEGPIGVDIEPLKHAPLNVCRRAFTSHEISYIHSSDFDKDIRFFECWTRKEAYTKQTGTGFFATLTDIDTLLPPIFDNMYTCRMGSYMCSVCKEGIHKPSPGTSLIRAVTEDEICRFFSL